MKHAVFLDRDGVLNPSVLNPVTGIVESPHHPDDFKLYPYVPESLRRLQQGGYALFIVSNQPSYAKAKTSLENIEAIAVKCERGLLEAGVPITKAYYCMHHPDSIVPGYGACECRKPSPYFLHQAREAFGIDLKTSWMIGDRDTDIQCGKAAGARTVLIKSGKSPDKSKPDYEAEDLTAAAEIVMSAK